MATKHELARVTAMAVAAWDDVYSVLSERGEAWPHTNAARWSPGLQLAFAEARAIAKVLEVLGGPCLDDIAQLHLDRKAATEPEPNSDTAGRHA